VGAGTLRTNLVIHHRVADILDQAAKPVHVLSAVQESCDPPPLFQRDEVLEDLIQFPSDPRTSDQLSILKGVELPFEHRPPPFLLDFTL
jgi:hypothetical protein